MDRERLQRWLRALEKRDRELFKAISKNLSERAAPLGAALEVASPPPQPDLTSTVLSIITVGRPALFIESGHITDKGGEIDAGARIILKRLQAAAPKVEPFIPLIGRIDVVNFPGSATYLGTGWLVDEDVVVTNRHVAEMIARWDGSRYNFLPGRFSEPLGASLDTLHEADNPAADPVKVEAVIYIEGDAAKADIAFLRIARKTDGTQPKFVPIARTDAQPNEDVAVVGYPARAEADVIPDQARMDRLFGGRYDLKRVAPGQMGENDRGWATHDCTTLGGNSGSCVLSLKTGEAVALHFAGLYLVENYAVPASILNGYLRDRPWQGRAVRPGVSVVAPGGADAVTTRVGAAGRVTVTVPLSITIDLGTSDASVPTNPADSNAPETAPDALSAARLFGKTLKSEDVVGVRPGYVIADGELTNQPAIIVAANADRLEQVQGQCPASHAGYPVVVRPATLPELALGTGLVTEAAKGIAYEDREGAGFSFEPVTASMSAICHVGPEQGWMQWRDFVAGTKKTLTSSMYQFFADHTAQSIAAALDAQASLTLVVAPQTRDGKGDKVKPGEFDRSDTFEHWTKKYKRRFKNIYVPVGSGKLVANAYHIKVTVKDSKSVWLSSGNWTLTSQPKVETADLAKPKHVSGMGNREWHVVLENAEIAKRFENHIKKDFEQSGELGGTAEAVAIEPVMVDVPRAEQLVAAEAAAARLIEPLKTGKREITVTPLLTPDRQGRVYTEAVLKLIKSAKKQIVFQNQYISITPDTGGNLAELVAALIDKAKTIADVRVIVRGSAGDLVPTAEELKRRGFPRVTKAIRALPNTHTKGIVVDGKRVLVGSQNWSSDAVTANRDASLIFEDTPIAEYFLDVFELDWARATPMSGGLSAAAVPAARLATTESPPPGYDRMTLAEYLEG